MTTRVVQRVAWTLWLAALLGGGLCLALGAFESRDGQGPTLVGLARSGDDAQADTESLGSARDSSVAFGYDGGVATRIYAHAIKSEMLASHQVRDVLERPAVRPDQDRGASTTRFASVVATNTVDDLATSSVTAGRRPTVVTRRAADDAARGPDGSLRCQYWDEPVVETPGSPLSREYGHVVPYAQGGGRDITNIVVSCRGCNRSKGPLLLDDWLGPR